MFNLLKKKCLFTKATTHPPTHTHTLTLGNWAPFNLLAGSRSGSMRFWIRPVTSTILALWRTSELI